MTRLGPGPAYLIPGIMKMEKDKEKVKVKRLCASYRPFAEIIQRNYLYVDKNKFIYDILNGHGYKACFLSRTRRFGKTLLLDTISELFQGDRDLFKGLWIGQSDYQFENHPVMFLDMSYGDIATSENPKRTIKKDLLEFTVEQEIELTDDSLDSMMKQLLITSSVKC
ncbi:MAG: AAA family ATPase [Deltaproteobacteria bacterium]|jgi:hypothetical protein|nr:AAA family ATPase [Deltaproteobacteria bacterium]